MENPDTEKTGGVPRLGKSLGDYAAQFTREGIQGIASQRVSTGFPALDRSLNGGLAEGLYVLGAVPGLGKSSLALQIASNVSAGGIPVLYFALEMNRNWITAKAICRTDFMLNRQPGLSPSALLDARQARSFSPAQWERLDLARERVQKDEANLYLYEQGPNMSHIGHIQEAIHAFRNDPGRQNYRGKPLMVVIDYLQILAPKDGAFRASDKQVVDENVRTLCKIRDQEEGVIILLISALNRVSYNNPIGLESFKESGSIEYSADVILGMQYQGIGPKSFSVEDAKARSPRELELTLLKMRYGQDGVKIPLHFYSEGSFFQQPDGEGSAAGPRLQELRKQFSRYPIQYHDGLHQKARRLKAQG